MPEIEIRPFTGSDEDYAIWVDVRNRIAPEYSRTVAEVKQWDEKRDPKCKVERWLVASGGKVVARGEYSQNPWSYHPNRFMLDVTVVPEEQGSGIGRQIFDHICAALEPLEPLSARCVFREDWPRSYRFAQDRGFVEDFRAWESRLNVSTFDATPFAHRYNEPEKHGITIKTAGQLKTEWPDLYERWYDMDKAATMDVPSPEPVTFLEFDRWIKWFEDNPRVLWDAIYLAVDEEKHIVAGVTSLWKRETDTDLETGFTGVHPDQRRKGIAFALKLRAIEYAKSVNCPTIRTDNASTNRPMLSINEALGFEKQPVWVEMMKQFRTDTVA